MISTPDGSDNVYTRLTEMRDPVTGDFIFNSLIEEDTCGWCKLNGCEGACSHVLMEAGQSEEGKRVVRAMYGADVEMYKQEVLGMITTTTATVFDSRILDRFYGVPPVEISAMWAAPWFVLAVDPALGGMDQLAATAILIYRKYIVIIALDCITLQPDDIGEQEERFLRALIRLIRTHELCTRDARMVFCVERNGNAEVSHIYHRVREMPEALPLHLYYGDREKKTPGLWSSFAMRWQYVAALDFYFVQNAAAFSARGVSASVVDSVDAESTAHERFLRKRELLFEQLRRLRKVPTSSGARVSYSGKVNQNLRKDPNLHDDLALSCLMATFLVHSIATGRANFRMG